MKRRKNRVQENKNFINPHRFACNGIIEIGGARKFLAGTMLKRVACPGSCSRPGATFLARSSQQHEAVNKQRKDMRRSSIVLASNDRASTSRHSLEAHQHTSEFLVSFLFPWTLGHLLIEDTILRIAMPIL